MAKGRECDRVGEEGGFGGTEDALKDFRVDRVGAESVRDFVGAIGCSPIGMEGRMGDEGNDDGNVSPATSISSPRVDRIGE